jgi:hypothetical protein
MADEIKTTIKKFEKMLCEKHTGVEKHEHFENGLGADGEPEVTKLWLYYSNDKHIGTYNRKERVAFLIGE